MRRLLILAAVLMLLTALAAGLAPQPRPAEPPATAAGADEVNMIVERQLSAALGEGESQTVRASVGDLIRLEIGGDVLDSVEIERLDRFEAIEPLTPARFDLIAEEPGVYPIRLVEADRRIGRLDIRP